MAIFKGNDIAGMVGPVVFLKLKDKGVIRSAPKQRNKSSWSDQQVMYRSKISRFAAFWNQAVPDECKQIFALAAKGMTAYNLFLKTNLPAFSPDGTQIDPAWLHLSVGKLPLPHQLSAARSLSDPSKIEVTWQNDPISRLARPKDKLLMIIAPDGEYSSPIITGAIRKQESAIINLPAGPGNTEGVNLFFGDEERELYSKDEWFGI
jgi:hypothetical protein